MLVVLFHKESKLIRRSGRGRFHASPWSLRIRTRFSVDQQLELSTAKPTHFTFRVQGFGVAAKLVSAFHATVRELGPDGVVMTAVDNREFWKLSHAPLGPIFPDLTMSVPITRNDPGSSVTHLMDECVS